MRFTLRQRHLKGGASRFTSLVLLFVTGLLPLLSTTAAAQSQTWNGQRHSPRVATLAQYRERVRLAAKALEEMASAYASEDGGGAGADADPDGAAARAQTKRTRDLLAPKERVEWGGGFIEADNSWLHEALDEAESAEDDEERAAVLRAAGERLRALEARLAELGGGAGEATDRDAERGRLNAVLRAPEFSREARGQGGALKRLVGEFFEWLLSILPGWPKLAPGASPQVSLLMQLLVAGLCLAILAYVARRLWLRRGTRGKSLGLKRGARVVLGERLEADQTASDLLDEAERLARAGDLRGAIRRAYVALLCGLGDRGVVRLERHKTNRDYLSAVRRAASPGLYTELLPLTFDFEMHWYGLRDASDADWESFRTRCRKVLKQSEV